MQKDEEIKGMQERERSALGGQAQRAHIEQMLTEIARLKQHVLMLKQRFHIQEHSEEHGYF